jgi:HK97 family phage major capsid protein
MKRSTKFKLLIAAALGLCAAFGIIDPASAALFFFIGDIEDVDGVLAKALSDHAGALKQFIERSEERQKKNEDWQRKHDDRILELEQKLVSRPHGGGGGAGDDAPGALTQMLMKSDGLGMFQKGTSRAVEIVVPRKLFKTAILNATLDANQPLVAPDRRVGITFAPQRRFTIRDLFPNIPTASNLVEFTSEQSFTNNAGPQGGGSSPTETEGQLKNESGMTFALSSAPVITLAHWIPASRQILSDAPQLQAHVENRLLYGLKLEEEDELLNGDGTAGTLNGLIHNATAFNRGSTGLTSLDAVALGLAQLIGSEYEPSGIVLNPADWWSTKFMLAKNSYGEYLLGNPGSMAEPRLWGLPVVVTNTMPAGNFLVLDAARTGYIADREDAIVRIAEQHADFFVRNMIVILVEERLAIVIQLGAAMVYGSLTF